MTRTVALGVVSYLNAVPLVHGLDRFEEISLVADVPSRLLDHLVAGRVDLSLCPVIDFQRSPVPLGIVPAGGIGSDGPTLTVSVFSREPIEKIARITVDGDSHTSAALLRVIMHDRFGRTPELCPLRPGEEREGDGPPAVLLIGDKVVTRRPPESLYPHRLDLGEAWKEMTGLPFVFAVWMARTGARLGRVPAILARQREENLGRIESLAAAYAPAAGWPVPLAETYLGKLLSYRIGPSERRAIQEFWERCRALGLIERSRPWREWTA